MVYCLECGYWQIHSNISGEVLFQVSEYIIEELKKGNADNGR